MKRKIARRIWKSQWEKTFSIDMPRKNRAERRKYDARRRDFQIWLG